MSSIPPSSSDYQSRITRDRIKETQDKAYQKILRDMGVSRTTPIEYLPMSDAATRITGVEQPPVLTEPGTTASIADQAAGLNTLADEAQATPQTSISLFQVESLMDASSLSKLDPNLTAALAGRIQETTSPKEFAQAFEDGLVQYFNPDGTPTDELQAALNGDGMGASLMTANIPDDVKMALDPTTPSTPESEQALRDYLDECLSKGWGEGKLSPMFALMLLLTQYNNMRSMMDEKLAMVRQQAIKAGYDAQVAEMMNKAYVALGTAIFTAVLTAASIGVQVKGASGKPKPSDEDAAELQQLKNEKAAVDKDIADVKDDIKNNQDTLKAQEIADDLQNNPNAKYCTEKEFDEQMEQAGFKSAPDSICDPDSGLLDQGKLQTKVAQNVGNLDNVKKELDAQEMKLDQLQRRSDMKEHSIEEKNNIINSKHNTFISGTTTGIQGFIQFGTGFSQFGQSYYDTLVKKLEYQVTEDTFYQRQLGTNEQQSDQSISSLRQSAAQAEESTSGTLGSIGRNIV